EPPPQDTRKWKARAGSQRRTPLLSDAARGLGHRISLPPTPPRLLTTRPERGWKVHARATDDKLKGPPPRLYAQSGARIENPHFLDRSNPKVRGSRNKFRIPRPHSLPEQPLPL